MDLYERIKNINGNNNEDELIDRINYVNSYLHGLLPERMCKVYNGMLYRELTKNHVPARLVNTIDIGLDYEHVFVLIPHNIEGYFLADLTFSQFNYNLNDYAKLLNDGYQFVDNRLLNKYLLIINKVLEDYYNLEDLYYPHSEDVDYER